MMSKDGGEHQDERWQIFLSLSPRTVMQVWRAQLERATQVVLDGLKERQESDSLWDFAMPVCGAALVAIMGLRQMTPTKNNGVSQAIIDGWANYLSNPRVKQAYHLAASDIDTHISGMLDEVRADPNNYVLSILLQAWQPIDNLKANIELVISGGQNEPWDTIAGTSAAVLLHPLASKQLCQSVGWGHVFK